ncbi:hypothetical protein DNH61_04660 [Paenibacillus sambharensis]|uniref:Uncharacterized protein n=2 Tax=Paenibacillus sambharensis TaxID=1803190 RepID=A0A2W1L9W7_9BACL|nr:hypothetical protein DNH61_04660 [Paenibacillus sambharensis]
MDFSFEHISESSINMNYNYGGEWFTFNLFLRDNEWIIHPFDSMLIRNEEMCQLVMAELVKHKGFQVMLAREGIYLSSLRSTVNVSGQRETEEENDYPDYSGGRVRGGDSDIDELIEHHSLDDLIRMEMEIVEDRMTVYNQILQRMFMEDLGPHDPEFQKVQRMVKSYEACKSELAALLEDYGFGSRKRF